MRRLYSLRVRGRETVLGSRTWLMGVLNVTPDSFSDGGLHLATDAAIRHGLDLFAAGADIVDVGGESTRPGAVAQSPQAEIRRVVPVITGLRQCSAGLLSVDTTKSDVARAALDAGADIVNDISGLGFDPALAGLVAERGVPIVLMHLRGSFHDIHRQPRYDDVMGEVCTELAQAVERALRGGVARSQIVVDPGIGFAKAAPHSLEVLRRLPELASLRCPILVGPSRKSFIGTVLERPVGERIWGTAAAVAACCFGGAHIVRVHDVAEMLQVVRVCDAIAGAPAAVAAPALVELAP